MSRFGIGQPVRRVEDARFITGRGRYVGDIDLPGMAHGQVLLSPRADHAYRRDAGARRAGCHLRFESGRLRCTEG